MTDDWKEFIASLHARGVRFLIVGAHALASYGHYRFTADLDVFLERSEENKNRLQFALLDFGIPITRESLDYLFSQEREMLELGHEPQAIDLLIFLDGVDFDEAWENRIDGDFYGQPAWILSVRDYIKTKVASGRPKDRFDLEMMRALGHEVPVDGKDAD